MGSSGTGAGDLEDSLRPVTDSLLDELCAWLRIPSISSGGGDPADLERAADWACERVLAAGGTAEVVRGTATRWRRRAALAPRGRADRADLRPLRRAVARPASSSGRPPRSSPTCATAGSTRAARATTRATSCRSCTSPASWRARASCRCTCASCSRARRRSAAPTCCAGSTDDERGADCAIVFDGGMVDETHPALHIGVRGIVMAHLQRAHGRAQPALGPLRRRGAERRRTCCSQMLAHGDARPRRAPARRAARRPAAQPSPEEIASWAKLPAAARVLAEAGATRDRPGRRRRVLRAHLGRREPRRQRHRERRRRAAPHDHPVHGRARASACALALGQSGAGDRGVARAHPARRRPRRAPRSSSTSTPREPAGFDPADPVLAVAREAIGRAAGSAPAARAHAAARSRSWPRSRERGIPTVLSGFALDADGIHGPDESYRLESLRSARRPRASSTRRSRAPLALGSGVGGECRLDALARDQLDAVGGRPRSSAPGPRRARTARAPSRRCRGGRRALAADAAAHAHEVARAEALGQRAQTVVPAQPAAQLGAHLAERRLEVVVHAHDLIRARARRRARPSARARPRGS